MTERRTFEIPGSGGLKCYDCGTLLTRVHRTRQTAGFVIRERICPVCQAINTTSERVLNARAPRKFGQSLE